MPEIICVNFKKFGARDRLIETSNTLGATVVFGTAIAPSVF
jgi:hypothetical protein